MRNRALLSLFMLWFSGAAIWADEFCARLDSLMDATSDTSAVAMFDLGAGSAELANCTHSLELGGALSLHCARAFDYRSPDAATAFDGLLQQVSACAVAFDRDDQAVSHPDSYDLRQFQMGSGIISVSLKDKGSLNQTYLFLRVSQASAP